MLVCISNYGNYGNHGNQVMYQVKDALASASCLQYKSTDFSISVYMIYDNYIIIHVCQNFDCYKKSFKHKIFMHITKRRYHGYSDSCKWSMIWRNEFLSGLMIKSDKYCSTDIWTQIKTLHELQLLMKMLKSGINNLISVVPLL